MFSSVHLRAPAVRCVSMLQGYRVLVTGLAPGRGVDTAQAFSERPTLLALHSAAASQDMVELAAHLAQGEGELRLFGMADTKPAKVSSPLRSGRPPTWAALMLRSILQVSASRT